MLLLVAVAVGQVSHQFGAAHRALVVYLPEHHAPVLPSHHAVLPQRRLEPLKALGTPRQRIEPPYEQVVVVPFAKPRHPLSRNLQQRRWHGLGSWWRWRVVQRHVIHWLVELLAQPADSVGVTEPFVLHEELDSVALLVAHEAAVGVAASVVGDGRRTDDEVAVVLVVMERAKARHVHARLAKRHEVANHVLNLHGILHAPDGHLVDFRHGLEMGLKYRFLPFTS